MRALRPPRLKLDVAREQLADAALLLIASTADGVAEVDRLNRPIVLTCYDGPKRLRVPIRWKDGVPLISARSRRSLRHWFDESTKPEGC